MGHEPFELSQNQREMVKYNAKGMLEYSSKEYQRYLSSDRQKIIHLQQAGEKLVSAFGEYIDFVNNTSFGNHGERTRHIREKELSELFQEANALHEFFYEGEVNYQRGFIEELYLRVRRKIKSRITKMR
jgi:hypothetical protein